MDVGLRECFVCASAAPPLYRVCACDALVHKECYERLVNIPSHATHCAVCRQPYNMTITWKRQRRWDRKCALASACLVLGGCACSVALSMVDDVRDVSLQFAFKLVVGFAIVVSFGLATILVCQHRRLTSRWCCLESIVEPVHKILHLPIAEASVPLGVSLAVVAESEAVRIEG